MARRLAEGLWLLDLGLVPPFATNCYLVNDGEAVTLVDAGLPVNYPSLATELGRVGYDRTDILDLLQLFRTDRGKMIHYILNGEFNIFLRRKAPTFHTPTVIIINEMLS